ncbi:MAG: cobalamin-binding protein, partial [Sciscionella sp.]|nr:cobalamin-binding protein [Sciscionella sp.]
MRVVSLLPAATDMVAALGLLHTLVGRTHECDWPAEVTSIPVVTASEIDQNSLSSKEISAVVGGVHRGSSLYTLDTQRLSELRPDVLLTQDLCEVCAVSYELVCDSVRVMAGQRAGESTGTPTVISVEPRTLSEIFQCLQRVGVELGAQDAAVEAVRALRDRLARVRAEVRAKT